MSDPLLTADQYDVIHQARIALGSIPQSRAYSLIAIINELDARLSAETQRREAAEELVLRYRHFARGNTETADSDADAHFAKYPKPSFDWQCPACGRTNPSTDTHCGCRYESPEEA